MKVENSNAFLKLLCSEYVSHHGEVVHMLENWKFSYTITVQNKNLRAFVERECPTENLRGEFVEKHFSELKSMGLIAGTVNTQFNLTEEGFSLGTAGIGARLLRFLNKNPGIISLGALLVSIGALYVSYYKP